MKYIYIFIVFITFFSCQNNKENIIPKKEVTLIGVHDGGDGLQEFLDSIAQQSDSIAQQIEDQSNKETQIKIDSIEDQYEKDLEKVYDNFLSQPKTSNGLNTSLEEFVISEGEEEGIKAFREFYEESLGKEVIDRYFERIEIVNVNGLPTVKLKTEFETKN
jgi:hypothetical protein